MRAFYLVFRRRELAAGWRYTTVAGTNYCYIGMAVDDERHSLVVMVVLDSVGKGGAHVAIENLNIMAGFARTAGLLDRGSHP